MKPPYLPLFLLIAIAAFLASCVPHKELVNFQEEPLLPLDSAEQIVNRSQVRIQVDDILFIRASSLDEDAARPFNQSFDQRNNNNNNTANNRNLSLSGYLVDSTGYIDFPVLGKVKLAGSTIEEAKATFYTLLKPYLNDVVVNIRFLNFRYTILGEVASPSTYTTQNTRVTILEALGQAGDLTDLANRGNILVIREQDGQRIFGRIDLKNKYVFTSPYFYLKQNDVVYVEPHKAKTSRITDPVLRYLTYVTGLITFVTLIISLTK